MKEIEKIDKSYFKCDCCRTIKHSNKYKWVTPITKNIWYLCNFCCGREFKKIKKDIDQRYEDNKL